MVEALILGREGTIVPEVHCYAPPLPQTIDDAQQMERWEAWVRAYVAIGEMLEGMSSPAVYQWISGLVFLVCLVLLLVLDCGGGTSASEDVPETDPKWCSAGPSCATIAPPKSWRKSTPSMLSGASIVFLLIPGADPPHPRTDQHGAAILRVYVEMRFKHALGCYRPVEYNAEGATDHLYLLLGHGTFPMGHARLRPMLSRLCSRSC